MIKNLSSDAIIGLIIMVIVACLNAIDAVLVRLVSDYAHPFMIGFTRSLFGLIIFLPVIAAKPVILRSQYRILHLVRAFLKLLALISFFYAFASARLADVTSIAFTTPIFVSIGAWVLLKEAPVPIRIIGLFFGFSGVVFVLKPFDAESVSIGLFFALTGAILTAAIQLLLKPMTAIDDAKTLVAWNLILTVPLAGIAASFYWVSLPVSIWVLLILQGVLGALNMWLVTKAFSLADASLLVPIEFLRLPVVAVLAYILFSEPVAVTTLIGGCLIFGGCIFLAKSAKHVSKTTR